MICTEKLPVPPILGGAIQTYIAGVLPHLKNHFDITVLGVTDPALPEQETIDGIQYVRVPGKIFEVYRDNVVQYVQSNKFDLIHIFNRPRLVLPVRNVSPNTKITLSMHNDMFGLEKIGSEEAERVVHEVTQIVTVSYYVGNVIRELYPHAANKLRTIYSGVDIQRFLPGNHPKMQKIRQELRKANGLENKTVILYAGRLSRNKGVDKLIQALPELYRRHKDIALVVVGSNWYSENNVTDYIAYVRAIAKRTPVPNISTGFVAPDEVQNWFAAADLFVCTSQWQEPLARVHYEAMAAGLPIITTARGGNAEVIQGNGLIVENPGDPNNFVETISRILSDKALMKRMGDKGRELASTRYTWERVAAELRAVWTQAKTAEQVHSNLLPSWKSETENIAQPLIAEEALQPSGNVAESMQDMVMAHQQDDIVSETAMPVEAIAESETTESTNKRSKKPFIITGGVLKNSPQPKTVGASRILFFTSNNAS